MDWLSNKIYIQWITLFCAGLFSLSLSVYAETIKSTTGNILFDADNDGTSELKLNTAGLAIGPNAEASSSNLLLQGNGIITENLSIGTSSSGNENLYLQGSVSYSVESASSNVTLGSNSFAVIDTSSANTLVTLPTAIGKKGRVYTIKKKTTDNVLRIRGLNPIDRNYWYFLNSGNTGSLSVISDGFQWRVLNTTSDITEGWSPAYITTEAWYDASDYATFTFTSGKISQWNDKSGNNKHVIQATDAARPVYNDANRYVEFDGGDYMTNGNTIVYNGSGVSAYLVVKQHNTTSSWIVGDYDTGDGNYVVTHRSIFAGAKNGVIWFDDESDELIDASGNITTAYDGGIHVIASLDSTTKWTTYIDGSIDVEANYTRDTTTLNTFVLGGFWFGLFSVFVGSLDGEIYEVVIVQGPQSDSDRQIMEGYLAWKWEFQDKLPSDHPYKHAAP